MNLSYIGLETAGFLNAFGYNTTVMVRSVFLRDFDQQMAELVVAASAKRGVRFLRNTVPNAIDRTTDGRFEVRYTTDGQQDSDIFDTVLFAAGRKANIDDLQLANAGVKWVSKSHKIAVDDKERTNVPNIFAVGDVIEGKPELTRTYF